MSCCRLLGRYGPSCLAGGASTGFVLGLWPKARPTGRFSCRVGPSSTPCRAVPWPIKSTTTHFYQYFHQILKYFIIFINITINNTQFIFTGPLPDRPLKQVMPMSVLRGSPGTLWSLRPGWSRPGGHHVVPCSGQTKSPSHGPGHQATWPCIPAPKPVTRTMAA